MPSEKNMQGGRKREAGDLHLQMERRTEVVEGLSPQAYSICFALLVATFLFHFGIKFVESPTKDVLTSIVCGNTYGSAAIRSNEGSLDARCANPEVQDQVASIMRWQNILDTLAGVLVAVPWGIFADKTARLPVLCGGMCGVGLGHILHAVMCKSSRSGSSNLGGTFPSSDERMKLIDP
jgi:hypothetical protein